jgi:two-component system, NtrC family, sensor kinase
MSAASPRRILVVDDMPAIHADFRKILVPPTAVAVLDDLEDALFGEPAGAAAAPVELASAYQGREALEVVQAALQAGRPYDLAFVDMRMPPGWDGAETIEHLWEADPGLKVVICSANADEQWDEVRARLADKGAPAILPKPFDVEEVRRLVEAAQR